MWAADGGGSEERLEESRYTKAIVRMVPINNSIRGRGENHGGELGQASEK